MRQWDEVAARSAYGKYRDYVTARGAGINISEEDFVEILTERTWASAAEATNALIAFLEGRPVPSPSGGWGEEEWNERAMGIIRPAPGGLSRDEESKIRRWTPSRGVER